MITSGEEFLSATDLIDIADSEIPFPLKRTAYYENNKNISITVDYNKIQLQLDTHPATP